MIEHTTDQDGDFLRCALKILDEWRHLPDYQLERRVDVFFGMLLPKIVEDVFGPLRGNPVVVPELPLHKRLLGLYELDENIGDNDNKSVKVDFALFCRNKLDDPLLLLVELKTDNKSIDCRQLKRMQQTQRAGPKKLLTGIIECARNTRQPRKYAQLIWRLNEIGCVRVPSNFTRMDMRVNKPGLTGNFRELGENFDSYLSDSWSNAEIQLALIYPGGKGNNLPSECKELLQDPRSRLRTIDFSRVATAVEGTSLAPFLMIWADHAAGTVNPWFEQ